MENEDIEMIWRNITTIHGNSFVADSIKDSLNKAASVHISDELKDLLKNLSLAVGKMSETLSYTFAVFD